MNLLVTAGNTRVFIDQVRCITNVFTGRTGAAIALEAQCRGHQVTLLTSHPETATDPRLRLSAYESFTDLHDALERHLTGEHFDAIIHSAAVSDYLPSGVFTPAPGTCFTDDLSWQSDRAPTLLSRAAAKVKSDISELWLRLKRAPKLIDKFRADWGFAGVLVKFKLEVGLEDARLLASAEESRVHSQADLMVANTLEGAAAWAFIGPFGGDYIRIDRQDLPARLVDAVENLAARRR